MGEVKRMVLLPGLPHGTASAVLRASGEAFRASGGQVLISYHDRTRHTGCIYKKAGFKRDGVTTPPSANAKGWATRAGSATAPASQHTPKRRWRLDLATCAVAR